MSRRISGRYLSHNSPDSYVESRMEFAVELAKKRFEEGRIALAEVAREDSDKLSALTKRRAELEDNLKQAEQILAEAEESGDTEKADQCRSASEVFRTALTAVSAAIGPRSIAVSELRAALNGHSSGVVHVEAKHSIFLARCWLARGLKSPEPSSRKPQISEEMLIHYRQIGNDTRSAQNTNWYVDPLKGRQELML